MAMVIDILSWVLILVGGAFGIIGGIGLLRFPDFFTRIHAAGITDTLCAPLIIGGLMLQSGLTLTTMKLVFLVVFLFLTSPTASHALAKAALHGGEKPILKSGSVSSAGPGNGFGSGGGRPVGPEGPPAVGAAVGAASAAIPGAGESTDREAPPTGGENDTDAGSTAAGEETRGDGGSSQ